MMKLIKETQPTEITHHQRIRGTDETHKLTTESSETHQHDQRIYVTQQAYATLKHAIMGKYEE